MIQTTGGAVTDKLVSRNYGDFPLNSGDWTILISFKYNATVTGTKYASILNLFDGLTDFTNPYVSLRSALDTNNVELKMFNGTTTVTSAVQAITNDVQNWAAITYNSTTHVATLIVTGITVGTVTINMSSVVFDNLTLLGDGASGTKSAISVAYNRAWSRILMSGELLAEAASVTIVSSTGLIFDCSLQTSIDLTSHNNTLNQLTATGTITTDLVDPLLTTVVAPPINVTPNTATEIDYNSAIFQDTLTTAAATTVWHKITALIGDKVHGACAFGDLVTYKPAITVYDGLANALIDSPLVIGNQNQPIQYPVTVGNTYYLKSLRNGAVTPATLKLSVVRGLTLTCPVGTMVIPDVTSGFPLAFLDKNIGYPINWELDFPVGESVGVLSDGTFLIEDDDNNGVKLFDSQFNLLATPAAGSGFQEVGSNSLDTFIVAKSSPTDAFKLVGASGVVDGTTYSIGVGNLKTASLSVNKLTAYIIQNTTLTNQEVKKFVLSTTTLSTFAVGIANFVLANAILTVNSDSSIIAGYNRSAVASKALRYNSDGTTANTYNLAADDQIDKLALDETGTFVVIWSQPTGQFSRFYKILISSGAVDKTINNVQKYNDGVYQSGSATNTPVRFGHSFSCPLWILREALFPLNNAKSGLYILTGTGGAFGEPDNPILRHDVDWIDTSLGTSENVKIPDPFYDTYLLGDE